MSGKDFETFEHDDLAAAQKMKDKAEAKDDYTLRCIHGEKVFFYSGEAAFAMLPGQIYSDAGRREFSISRCCEYHFDRHFDERHIELREVNNGIERVLYTVPTWTDYQGDKYEARFATLNPANADVISSEVYGEPGVHVVALDIDHPARLLPSSTPDHYHLHVDVKCSWEDYEEFLRAAAKIGLIEEGYARVSIERKGTHLRLPWVRKEEPTETAPAVDGIDANGDAVETVRDWS